MCFGDHCIFVYLVMIDSVGWLYFLEGLHFRVLFLQRLLYLSVYRGYNPRRMSCVHKESLDLPVQQSIGFWLIRALVISQLFFKTSKLIWVLWCDQFPGNWLCDAAFFPSSGHFMLGKDPQLLRKMQSFSLLNKRPPTI